MFCSSIKTSALFIFQNLYQILLPQVALHLKNQGTAQKLPLIADEVYSCHNDMLYIILHEEKEKKLYLIIPFSLRATAKPKHDQNSCWGNVKKKSRNSCYKTYRT